MGRGRGGRQPEVDQRDRGLQGLESMTASNVGRPSIPDHRPTPSAGHRPRPLIAVAGRTVSASIDSDGDHDRVGRRRRHHAPRPDPTAARRHLSSGTARCARTWRIGPGSSRCHCRSAPTLDRTPGRRHPGPCWTATTVRLEEGTDVHGGLVGLHPPGRRRDCGQDYRRPPSAPPLGRADRGQDLTTTKLDALIGHIGPNVSKTEMTGVRGFTSELFPMMPYISCPWSRFLQLPRGWWPPSTRPCPPTDRTPLRTAHRPGHPFWIWMVATTTCAGAVAGSRWANCARRSDLTNVPHVVDLLAPLSLAHTAATARRLQGLPGFFTTRYLPGRRRRRAGRPAQPLAPTSAKALKRAQRHRLGQRLPCTSANSRVGICDSAPTHGPTAAHIVRDYLSLGPRRLGLPLPKSLDPLCRADRR